ncbi:MAG: hypothetical protein AVDCRST_MAG53-3005, partial [uncultured Solirubrobacteraceae bacterium]
DRRAPAPRGAAGRGARPAAAPVARPLPGRRRGTHAGAARRPRRRVECVQLPDRSPARARGSRGGRTRGGRRAGGAVRPGAGRAADRRGRRAAVPGAPGRRRQHREPSRAAVPRRGRGGARVRVAADAPRLAGPLAGRAGLAGARPGRRARPLRRAGDLLRGPRSVPRERPLLLRAVHAAVPPARARRRLDAAPGPSVPRCARGAGAGLRGRRLRRVRDAHAAAQPQGHLLQPVRGVLPGQLALLRPEHLRPLPRAGDAGGVRRARVDGAPARRRWRGGGARRALGGARADVLAVVVHRADRRPRGARRPAVEPAPGPRRRGRARGRRCGPGRARARGDQPERRLGRRARQGDERPLRPRGGRRAHGRRAARGRLGLRLVPAGLPARGGGLRPAGGRGVAHDSGDGRRGAGGSRPARLSRAARRDLHASRAGRAAGPRARVRARGVLRAGRSHAAVRGLPRGPADLGAARSGQRLRGTHAV